ncbi:MAG: bifunctional alpha,alpha-trehalose-phosphate synthase (UDP-forming)/trehalose-phosphatase [bacterium]
MSRLVIVSNRLPVTVARKDGKLHLESSAGGLATGLGSVARTKDSVWVGWCGMSRERLKGHEDEVDAMLLEKQCKCVNLTRHDIEYYYHGFSNKTIWPLFHYFPIYTVYNKHFWDAYKRVNREFCDEVLRTARKGDTIWIHDYQLMLLPKMLREELPDATIGFFLHIPFVSSEVFRLLPWRREILEGILGADLVGFHTYDYVRHFDESVRRVCGYEHNFGFISVGSRTVRVDAFPMGIDYKHYSTAGERPGVQEQCRRIRRRIGDRKLILGIDRLDYTKGIPERLEVFDLFLERNPEYRGNLTLVMVAVPSRTGVEHYRMLKRRVDELVGRINGKYGSIDWIPVWYLYRSVPFDKLIALYKLSDVALVTPLRDGMNLIAKEFVASKTDGKGVLILSEMAGAAKELGEALIVNPNNQEEIVAAMEQALSMPEEDQIERNRVMQHRLARYSIGGWVGDFMDRLERVKRLQADRGISRLTPDIQARIVKDYKAAGKRLILLDYDGTLVPFSKWPRKARPDQDLSKLLARLARNRKNEVVMVSGRDRETLDEWLGQLGVGLVAEHGVWVREPGGEWEAVENLKDDWKAQVRPLLELYVDRTPGSFIEEKSFSLAWHYRKADPVQGSTRSRELRDDLENLVANLNIGILEGSKVTEVKDLSVNKGRASSKWVARQEWGFILAIGDDWTDEDMFEAVPETAYSIRVGLTTTRARFNVGSHQDVRNLLAKLRG